MNALDEIHHRLTKDFAYFGLIMGSLFLLAVIVYGVALLLLIRARLYQEAAEDRRLGLDLLEKGILTLPRCREIPPLCKEAETKQTNGSRESVVADSPVQTIEITWNSQVNKAGRPTLAR